MSDVRWIAEHFVEGVLHGRVGRAGDELVAEWTGVGRLRVRRDGTGARFVAEPGADPADVEKIRRGSVNLLLRHLDGKLALHGAAASIGGRAVGLYGPADAGKSTLAASLCARAGATLLADDAIALDRTPAGFAILPLEIDHWLDAASRRALGLADVADIAGSAVEEGKRPVRARAADAPPAVLAALVHVAFEDVDAPRLTPLSGIEALASILPQVVRFVVDEPDLQRTELEELAHLVREVPLYRLERPRRLDLLLATTTAVADLVRNHRV